MKFWQAMKALEEGKKVRAKWWPREFSLGKNGYHMELSLMKVIKNTPCEWELYEESQQPDVKSREDRLKIARVAYKEVKKAIERSESRGDILHHWDECITIDDELFHGHELREEHERMLTFMQILEGLKEGKKFRREDWGVDKCISNSRGALVDERNVFLNYLLLEDFEATDWIEVK